MKLSTLIMVAACLCGCDSSKGEELRINNSTNKAKNGPSSLEIRQGISANYTSPSGMYHECLGRLIFDVPLPVRWPTYASNDSDYWLNSVFSKNVFDRGDGIRFGDVEIGVVSPVTESALEEIEMVMPIPKIARLRNYIKKAVEYIEKVKKSKISDPKIQTEIEEQQASIREWEKMIAATQSGYETLSLPVADAEGFWTSEVRDRDGGYTRSIVQAFVRHKDSLFVFRSKVALSQELTKERHLARFIQVLAGFRARKAHEIPTELGVCIPHGFIADDGRTITDIKQSIRFEDAPGVLYTIQTGNSTERNEKAAFISAIGTAMAGKVDYRGESGPRPELTHQIVPHLTKIGELNASQGGFAIKITKPGTTPFEVYNVFTGYSGWRDVAVLPFILIEMSTRTIEQAPELTQNPPPFKQSMGRLETLLKSTHLRPTNPLMPELAGLESRK